MTKNTAIELVGHSKSLFRFQSPEQGAVLCVHFERFPNPLFVQQTLEYFAAHPPTAGEATWTEGNPPIPAIVERLNSELARLGQTTHDARKLEQKQEEAKTSANWITINRLIDELSDQDLEELKPAALDYLPPPARKLLENRKVRDSKTLRGLVYRAFDAMRSQR